MILAPCRKDTVMRLDSANAPKIYGFYSIIPNAWQKYKMCNFVNKIKKIMKNGSQPDYSIHNY